MYFQSLIDDSKKSLFEISNISNVPYATLHELYSGKTDITKAKVDTLYKLCETLNVSVDDLLYPYYHEVDFEIFKCNMCHELKHGNKKLLKRLLEGDWVMRYYRYGWYLEMFYTLGMCDYICNKLGLPLANRYDFIREQKLPEMVLPPDLQIRKNYGKDISEYIENALPEWKRFNIIEGEPENVA